MAELTDTDDDADVSAVVETLEGQIPVRLFLQAPPNQIRPGEVLDTVEDNP